MILLIVLATLSGHYYWLHWLLAASWPWWYFDAMLIDYYHFFRYYDISMFWCYIFHFHFFFIIFAYFILMFRCHYFRRYFFIPYAIFRYYAISLDDDADIIIIRLFSRCLLLRCWCWFHWCFFADAIIIFRWYFHAAAISFLHYLILFALFFAIDILMLMMPPLPCLLPRHADMLMPRCCWFIFFAYFHYFLFIITLLFSSLFFAIITHYFTIIFDADYFFRHFLRRLSSPLSIIFDIFHFHIFLPAISLFSDAWYFRFVIFASSHTFFFADIINIVIIIVL